MALTNAQKVACIAANCVADLSYLFSECGLELDVQHRICVAG